MYLFRDVDEILADHPMEMIQKIKNDLCLLKQTINRRDFETGFDLFKKKWSDEKDLLASFETKFTSKNVFWNSENADIPPNTQVLKANMKHLKVST